MRGYNETNLWFKRVQMSAALTKTFETLRTILQHVLIFILGYKTYISAPNSICCRSEKDIFEIFSGQNFQVHQRIG